MTDAPIRTGQRFLAALPTDQGIIEVPVVIVTVYKLFKNVDDSPLNYWVADDNGDKYMVDESQLRTVQEQTS